MTSLLSYFLNSFLMYRWRSIEFHVTTNGFRMINVKNFIVWGILCFIWPRILCCFWRKGFFKRKFRFGEDFIWDKWFSLRTFHFKTESNMWNYGKWKIVVTKHPANNHLFKNSSQIKNQSGLNFNCQKITKCWLSGRSFLVSQNLSMIEN